LLGHNALPDGWGVVGRADSETMVIIPFAAVSARLNTKAARSFAGLYRYIELAFAAEKPPGLRRNYGHDVASVAWRRGRVRD
jgi:hypothetical protein